VTKGTTVLTSLPATGKVGIGSQQAAGIATWDDVSVYEWA
jgi:hypothetical protein